MPAPIDLFYFSPRFRVYIIREAGEWTSFRPSEIARLLEYLRHKAALIPAQAVEHDTAMPAGLRDYLESCLAPVIVPPQFSGLTALDLNELGL